MTTWLCPPGVTAVLVECWGGGGNGMSSAFPSQTSPGGGGGAYSRKAGIPVTPGNSYAVQWAKGGLCFFKDTTTVVADFGSNASFQNHTSVTGQGLASNCIGDTKYDGGGGFAFEPSYPTRIAGGGGGGGAGRAGAGTAAGGQTGAPASTDFGTGKGGDGSNGSDSPAAGGNATQTGCGGGAAGSSGGSVGAGGAGFDGAIRIWDDTSGHGWAGVIAGTSPGVGSFGSPPPDPPPPPVTRKSISFMM